MARGIVVDPAPLEQKPAALSGNPPPADPPADDGLPEKFKGKTAKEIAEAYVNLESELGRVRNDIGDLREEARTWRALAEDLGTQIRRPAEPERKPVEISPDQLISDPRNSIQAVVDDLLDKRLEPIVKDTRRVARDVEVSEFVRDFPNYVEIGNDPEFKEFVAKSPRRRELAVRALEKEDIKAMRSLLEDWNERKELIASLSKKQEEHQEQTPAAPTGVEGARKVATERPGNTAAVPSGRIFYQTDVINVMLTDPDRYYSAPYQEELMKAIRERRFKK